MNTSRTVLVVLSLVGAVALAHWVQNRPRQAPALEAGAAAASAPAARSGASGPGGPGGPAPVEVAKVEAGRIEEDAQAVGTLRSRQGVMLRPEVSGRISRLSFGDGQPVKRGQLLVQLDDTLQQAQLRQAEAQAGIAATQLQRNRELQAQNFVSQSAVDQSQANLEVAQAQVALNRAQLARMKIVAPFDGVAGIRNVNLGDYVKDGADLVNIEDLSWVSVDFRLPERVLPRLKPGQTVELGFDALPGKRYAAKVAALDSQLDANGRSVLVRARVTNSAGELKPGMFARARIVFEVREQALLVPEEALVPLGDKQFLIKVVDGADGAKVSQKVQAQIGQRVAGKVEVLAGVMPGDTVVVAGQSRLMRGDGLPVRVVDLSRPGGGRGAGGRPGAASGAASGAGSGVASKGAPA